MKKSVSEDAIIAVVTLCIVVCTALFIVLKSQNSGLDPGEKDALNQSLRLATKEQIVGRMNLSKISNTSTVLVEFGDYQCPPCRAAHKSLSRKSNAKTNKMVFVFRHFPLKELHTQAFDCALYAEAARDQNKFNQMHNLLMNSTDLRDLALQSYAKEIGLDTDTTKASLSRTAQQRVSEDMEDAERLKVSGTPTFVLLQPNSEPRVVSSNEVENLVR